ncbi:hypothetical protein CBP36_12410 [Acidovorax carolinensis]|uniref:Uncharacterized protein n=2 Tax=Acidovorax carolinensis TaxID=553814 RepID=A0A240UET5_9BURK|nr:hypothetical protein CBP36_12410 [Acidovorax carolinensis]
MVITSYIPAEKFSRAVEHPCQFWIGTIPFRLSIFGRRQQTVLQEYSVPNSPLPAHCNINNWLTIRQSALGLSDSTIATALGYGNPKVVQLIKDGAMRLPLNRAQQFADVLQLPPGDVMRQMLREIDPSVLEAVEICMAPSMVLTEPEQQLIHAMRKAAPGRETRPIMVDRDAFVALIVA